MKKLILTLFMLIAAHAAIAQPNDQEYKGHAYVFGGLARPFDSAGSGMTVGGGGEAFVYRGLAVGGDIAYLFPTENPANGIGMLSINPAYHFLSASRSGKLVPFVTGGYSLGFRSGTGHFFNYGGGMTYWFSRKIGLRLEVRDHRYAEYPRDSVLTFRAGLSFR